MSSSNNKRIIKIVQFKSRFSSKRLVSSFERAKQDAVDFLIFSDIFKCDINAQNKFNLFQQETIDDSFLTQFVNLKNESSSAKIKLGFGFDLLSSFTAKEIRDNREYLVAFFNFLIQHLCISSFFFERANELPKEFLIEFFAKIKGVYVFGSTSSSLSNSLSDFELYSLGFNALQSTFLEHEIDKLSKNNSKASYDKLATLLSWEAHYFNNYYRIFKDYKNKKISSLLNKEKSFVISYDVVKR